MTALDPQLCYQALVSRDARFDGRWFVGVASTGVYCRPVCSARTPKPDNCHFFASSAAAQAAGFRPCLRCRPETAPEHAAWRGTSNTVARGLDSIAEGALDGPEGSVERLAERLGVGQRHLRRLFEQHLGASPVAVAQTRRVLFAKQLLHETLLPMSEVALAAGFGSVRRFNETFQALYARPPSALRRSNAPSLPEGSTRAGGVSVRLRYRPPYDFGALLAFLRARAISGVERIEDQRYARTLQVGSELGSVEIQHLPESSSLLATMRVGSVALLPLIVNRIRQLFDLASDVSAIGAHLAIDPLLAPLVVERPGLRVPGAWDGFELGVRAVLGQQVSVEAGRALTSELVRLCGTSALLGSGLTRVFPSAEQVVAADLSRLRLPGSRRQALVALATAALEDPCLFEPAATLDDSVERLERVPGVGAWTAHYIALRAAREPDAFPASDRRILRGMALVSGADHDAARLSAHAERWRPWRAYAAQHLWAADAARESVRAEPRSQSKETKHGKRDRPRAARH